MGKRTRSAATLVAVVPAHANETPTGNIPDRTEANPGKSLSSYVRSAALWSAATTMSLRFANIAIMAVVARLLTPRDFGVFAVAVTIFTIVSSLGELGVSSCLMRGDVDPDEIAPTVATISMVSSTVLAVLMFTFAHPLAAALGAPTATAPLRVLSLAVLMVGIFAVPGALLVRDFRQRQRFLATVIGFLPANVILIVVAASGGGAMAFAWSRVIGQAVTGTVIMVTAGKFYWPGFVRKSATYVLKFGLPLAGANLLNFTLLNADYVLVGRLLGTVRLGIYMLAFNIASWSSGLLAAMINGVAMPAFSRVKSDPVLLKAAVVRSTQLVSAIALPICALTFALARPLIVTVYGGRWASAAPVLSILTLYGAMSIVCLLQSNALVGLSRTRLLLLVQMVWLAALVPTMAEGVRVDGIVGAGIAHLVVISVVVMPIYVWALRKADASDGRATLKALAQPVASSLIAGSVAYLVSTIFTQEYVKLLAGGSMGALVYVVFLTSIWRPHIPIDPASTGRLSWVLRQYDSMFRYIGWGSATARDQWVKGRLKSDVEP